MNEKERTALVTGATSGLGFESAAQLAERGLGKVVITGRTIEKAKAAQNALVERTGREVFSPLSMDNDKLATVEAAAESLRKDGTIIDVLILNAGIAPPAKLSRSADGYERTVSSSLLGHHVLTMRLLQHGLLGAEARIIVAGSEAATGAVPGFAPVDLDAMASTHFGGDLSKATRAQMVMEPPASYKSGDVYATAKTFVAHWAAELSRNLPDGMSVATVSPGSVPDTNAIRNGNFFMRYIMVPTFKLIPGMSHTVADGARRYLDTADRGLEVTGQFLASAPKKMTGALHTVDLPHIKNETAQKKTWDVTAELCGVGLPAHV